MRLGFVRAQIISADSMDFLWKLAKENIPVTDVKFTDLLTFQLTVSAKCLQKLQEVSQRENVQLRILQNLGVFHILISKLKRPLIPFAVLIWVALLLYLPSKVLFVNVIGNNQIDTERILEKAEICGLSFGADRRKIRSEKIKNALLSEIPELQWVGVNTRGCLAEITVQERVLPARDQGALPVGNIVASRDGVITEIVTTRGTALCRPGQAVSKGQLLVSGYTDSGFALRAEVASAEVFAVTERPQTAVWMQKSFFRGENIDTCAEYSIQIGKNVVELFRRGKVPDSRCCKILETAVLTLPGGFCLPIKLIKETNMQYADAEVCCFAQEAEIKELLDGYLKNQMLMGKIRSSDYRIKAVNDISHIRAIYICEEMIGMLRKEEIVK